MDARNRADPARSAQHPSDRSDPSGAASAGSAAEGQAQAKRPLSVLAGAYGHPLHPAVVPIPIGAWVASLVFDVGSHVADDPQFLVRGATWLLAIGLAGAVLAGMVGFLDLVVVPTGTRAYRTAVWHLSLMLAASTVFLLGVLLRRDTDPAEPVGVGLLALSVAGLLLLAAGGFLGGELAYRFGVRVADEDTQRTGYRPSTRTSPHRGEGD